MSNRLTIRVISWNLGESSKPGIILDWNKELAKWDILEDGSDLIFLSIEEASSLVGKNIGEALKKKMSSYDVFFEGEGTNIPSLNFHVFGYLCIKKNDQYKYDDPVENNKKDKTIDTICFKKKYICTKPSVSIGIEITKTGYIPKTLVFIGSHLPVNTKDKETYGYNLRLEAMRVIRKELLKNVEKAIGAENGADAVFWTGDFNFRIQEGTEQLANAMKTDILSEFQEHDLKDVVKTCRYKEYMGNNETELQSYSTGRISKTGESDDPNLEIYDSRRIPSYCDRVIYKMKSGTTFKPTKYYSWPNNPEGYPISILRSDHTVIVLEGYIDLQKDNKSKITIASHRYPSQPLKGGYLELYAQNKFNYLNLSNQISV